MLFLALKSLRALIQISLAIIIDPAKPIRKLERFTDQPKNKKIIRILSANGSKISPICDVALYFLAKNPSR